MRALALTFLGLLVGVVATLGYQSVIRDKRNPGASSTSGEPQSMVGAVETSNTARPGNISKRSVHALGTLEPRNGSVLIGSALIGLQVKKVNVAEGQRVSAGNVLIELDATAVERELQMAKTSGAEAVERQAAEVEQAKLRLAAAKLAVTQAHDARELELAAHDQKIVAAELKVTQLQSDLKRMEGLRRNVDPLVSEQQFEQQRVLTQGAIAERDAYRVARKRAEQVLDFEAQKGAMEESAAKKNLEIAEKATGLSLLDDRIALAELKLSQTKIVAPQSGTIVSINAHEGEVVASQPLMQLADLSKLQCVAEVDIADVYQLRKSKEATITSRAFRGKTVTGKIERLGTIVGSAVLRPLDPRAPIDRSVTKVVIEVDASEIVRLIGSDLKNAQTALMGLQVEVEFPL